ncbi:sulfite exporter TauE/SafE family protein [Methylobacillus flagellatus]|uniref:sulfite exporter TauE/SafE family protein n=1 Tax=Methylobacillus flagellatus TaxID=405 RepID=UPI002853F231|nr:sulfite exporter TauE/SafE family protein [Methylobacillus flagellatus]MDR5171854.1 sulfite exporter TauE/SafE family protein [Methylobacillus flagellatus]
MPELSLFAALLVGLLGGGHCAGMCGGIVGAVSMSMPGSRPQWRLLLAYNLGRIGSYGVAGAIAGAVGASSFFLQHLLPVGKVLYALANIILILLGLYLANLWHGVIALERIGAVLWKRLQPFSKRWLPVRNIAQAGMLGAIWGWLPCGLVYSVLIAALATGSPVQGGLLMLAFGMGTLPTLLAMGMAAVRLKAWLQQLWLRRISGLTVLLFGVLGLVRLWF